MSRGEVRAKVDIIRTVCTVVALIIQWLTYRNNRRKH